MSIMKIMPPALSVQDGRVRLSAEIIMPRGSQTLWFECAPRVQPMLDVTSCDAFVVAMLVRAQHEGWDIEVCGPMSARLYYNISHHYIELMRHCAPGLHKIGITARYLSRARHDGTGVIAGFSAGVDSFCTVADHAAGRVPPEYQLTHLLMNNVGSHGQNEHDYAVFLERQQRLEPLAHALGLELVAVNSNLDALLGMNFQLTHVARNAAVGLLLQKGIGKYMYSAAYHYRDCKVIPTPAYGDADALLVPMLSTESLECIDTGAQYTRFEKTALIADQPLVQQNLDVCVSPVMAPSDKVNCSRCWKCLRTQASLEIVGKLQNFSAVFDLDTYQAYRWLYLCYLARSPKPMAADIHTGMKEYNYRFPLSARLAAYVVPPLLVEQIVLKWPMRGTQGRVPVVLDILKCYLSGLLPLRLRRWLRSKLR